ncbi:MAG: hypothetical protein AAF550_12815, partial [Myxococcota bacterium]
RSKSVLAASATVPKRALKLVKTAKAETSVKVYPGGMSETFCTDHWRCRFLSTSPAEKKQAADPGLGFDEILRLLSALHEAGLEVIKTEHLYEFDGVRGYSLGQGE